jgi:hypothetical protein
MLDFRTALRTLLPFSLALAVGIFLSIASHALAWDQATTITVGSALIATIALCGTPLVLLLPPTGKTARPDDEADRTARVPNRSNEAAHQIAIDHVAATNEAEGASQVAVTNDFTSGFSYLPAIRLADSINAQELLAVVTPARPQLDGDVSDAETGQLLLAER